MMASIKPFEGHILGGESREIIIDTDEPVFCKVLFFKSSVEDL